MALYLLIIGVPIVLVGIAYAYIVESNWYEDDFKLDDEDDIG